MIKGQTFDTPITTFRDKRTGREVQRLTGWDDCHCLGTYMYYQAFSADERYVVFASDRTGEMLLHRVDLERGRTVQLTDIPCVKPQYHIHPVDQQVYYSVEGAVRAVDLHSLEDRCVVDARDLGQWKQVHMGKPLLTDDARQAMAHVVGHDELHRLLLVDLANGNPPRELLTLDDPELSLGHTIAAPGSELVISFNINPDRQNKADLPHDRRARCWGYRDRGDGGGAGKVFNLLTMPIGHRATHETWGSDRRLYFHRKSVPGWTPAAIASVNEHGEDYREHFTSEDRKLGHSCVSPDCKWIVSDVQDAEGNELYLVERDTGESEILCWPDSSVRDGQIGHVHPQFSPTGTKVLYTSDVGGKAAVFVVPLP